MNPLLAGYWRGYKTINARGTVVLLGSEYGPLFKINDDQTVEHSYKDAGKWGTKMNLKLKMEHFKTVITGDVVDYYVKSVSESELILVVGKYEADLTYYLKRVGSGL